MKKIFNIVLVAALAVMSFGACSTYVSLEPLANKEWQGKTHAQIIQSYGAPDRETSDGQGGIILVYESETTEIHTDVTPSGFGGFYGFYYDFYSPGRDVRTTTETKVEYAHFYLDAKGICYKVATNLQKEVRQ